MMLICGDVPAKAVHTGQAHYIAIAEELSRSLAQIGTDGLPWYRSVNKESLIECNGTLDIGDYLIRQQISGVRPLAVLVPDGASTTQVCVTDVVEMKRTTKAIYETKIYHIIPSSEEDDDSCEMMLSTDLSLVEQEEHPTAEMGETSYSDDRFFRTDIKRLPNSLKRAMEEASPGIQTTLALSNPSGVQVAEIERSIRRVRARIA